jgi:hypothetical protein
MEDDNGKAMLAVSSLVNRLCLFNDACDNDPAVNEIISSLESKIGSSCRVNDATMKTVRNTIIIAIICKYLEIMF